MKRPVHVIAHAEFRPECEEAATRAFMCLARLSRKEPGCLRYDIFRDSDNPARFSLIAVFASKAAVRQHLAAAHRKQATTELEPMLAARPDFNTLLPVDITSGV